MKTFILALTLCLSAHAVLHAQDMNTLQLDSYFDMESVSNPQISPDGSEIVYTRGWIDNMNDRRESSLWIVNSDGSKNRFLVDGGNPQWSPDGTRIAYTADGEAEGTQLFVKYHQEAGAATQITRLEETPGNITWSPDGQWIAFTMFTPKGDDWNINMPKRPDGATWTESPRVVESLLYRRDRVGFYEEGFTHIYIVPADGGAARQISSGDWHHGRSGISWTPDGNEILFSSLRIDEAEYAWRESEIYAVDVESGQTRQLTSRKGPDTNPKVSPDGKWVAYTGYDWTDDAYNTSRLYIIGIDGSNPKAISASLDRTPSGLQWASDNSGVYFNANDRGTRNLYFASVGGEVEQVTSGNHMLTVSDISWDGMAAGVLSDHYNHGQLVYYNLLTADKDILVDVNEDVLDRVTLGEVEEINYPSLDDFTIQGWVIKPPDFDPANKYPLILVIHGGPHGMYNVGFNYAWQVHAANGYVVLYTNPRGSSGYGKDFGNSIKNAYPGKDYNDLMTGVDLVVERGYIDEDNMFVYGCSGGGVLTSWIVGQTDRFAAASANCPVTNWLSFVGTTDGASWYRNFEHYPWEDPSEHLRRSPLMYVGNVKTPTMLMTGVNDLRTPISQTEEYYQALKVLKVPTAMIRFNDEFHGTGSKPSNYVRTQLYLYHWFNKHSRNKKEDVDL